MRVLCGNSRGQRRLTQGSPPVGWGCWRQRAGRPQPGADTHVGGGGPGGHGLTLGPPEAAAGVCGSGNLGRVLGEPGGRGSCSDLIVLLSAQTKGQLELGVILGAAGRGLGEREREGAGPGRGAGPECEGRGRRKEREGRGPVRPGERANTRTREEGDRADLVKNSRDKPGWGQSSREEGGRRGRAGGAEVRRGDGDRTDSARGPAAVPGRPPPCSWPARAAAAAPPPRCSAARPAPPRAGAQSPRLRRKLREHSH